MMKKTVCIKFDKCLKDADILRGCAKALDHTSEQYGTDVKIDTIQFDRGNGMVTMETILVGPVSGKVMDDLRSMFNEIFGGVI